MDLINKSSAQQQVAITKLKQNLHLPNGGFHALIVDLSREYLLPFQQVRSVLKQVQQSIEANIGKSADAIDENALTYDNWISLIRNKLEALAKGNIPVMQAIEKNDSYIWLNQQLSNPVEGDEQRQQLIESIEDIYQREVYQPLMAMLYTSMLYWELRESLEDMTQERIELFKGYPEHMQACLHLIELQKQIVNGSITT